MEEPQATPVPETPFASLAEAMVDHIALALARTGGNQRTASKLLGITRWSLARRIKRNAVLRDLVRSRA